MIMDKTYKIGAVIVLYNPDIEGLNQSIAKLLPQLDSIILIDNSSVDNSSLFLGREKIVYKPLLDNVGIAKAQNIGTGLLAAEDFDFVLFSDQDSLVSDDVVEKLCNAYVTLVKNGYLVGAIGTKAINKSSGIPYPPKSKTINSFSLVSDKGDSVKLTECYSIRSSVSLISIETINNVGGFDENLFIDGVDHEWCWRAWHFNGLRSFVVENALLYHQLGEGDRTIAGKEIAISSSKRLYYQYRNYLWLCRRKYVPRYWKKKNGVKYMVKALYYPLFISPRYKNLVNIWKGIYDGLFTR